MRLTTTGVLAVLVLAAGCTKGREEPNPAAPSVQYLMKVLECLDHTERILSDMKTPADAAAERWVAGGRI